jgi:hypothetical protein
MGRSRQSKLDWVDEALRDWLAAFGKHFAGRVMTGWRAAKLTVSLNWEETTDSGLVLDALLERQQ